MDYIQHFEVELSTLAILYNTNSVNMSLKAVCEVLVYFESFKNWDLYDQGIYFIKARLEQDLKDKQKEIAAPYHMIEVKKQLRSRRKKKIRGQSQIQDVQYRTKAFLIKYTGSLLSNPDEQIDLDEAVVFRIQMQTFPEFNSDNIYLVLDLHHALQFYFESESGSELEYKKVATTKLKLNNLENGFARFSSVGFGENFKGNINVTVFSILMDYKFRIFKANKVEKTPKEAAREKAENLDGYYKWLWSYTSVTPQNFYDKHIKHIRYHSYNACKEWSKCITKPIPVKMFLPKYCLPEKQQSSELVEVDDKTFTDYIANYKVISFDAARFSEELQNMRIQTYSFFQDFIKELSNDQLKKHMLQEKFHKTMKERCGEFIFRQQIKEEELADEKYSGRQKRNIAKKIRKGEYFETLEAHNVEDLTVFPKLSQQPILFHEISQLKEILQPSPKILNQLFVFSHGFQGSSYDMLNVKTLIKQFYPKANFLIARSNEGMTDGDIIKMGQRLAKEIIRYIKDEDILKDLQINMVGHSLGGLILRAALPHLQEYKDLLGTFMTFGTPHLGYLHGMKTMIKTGLWFIKSWNKTYSLDQLTMTDNKNLQQTTLYKLSKTGSLKNFRNIVLLSSYQDSYVPWHSARIHPYKSTVNDERAIVEKNMVHNILQGGSIQKIHRIDVSFEIVETNVDSMIGRTAHMRFLTDDNVLRMVLYCMPEIFT